MYWEPIQDTNHWIQGTHTSILLRHSRSLGCHATLLKYCVISKDMNSSLKLLIFCGYQCTLMKVILHSLSWQGRQLPYVQDFACIIHEYGLPLKLICSTCVTSVVTKKVSEQLIVRDQIMCMVCVPGTCYLLCRWTMDAESRVGVAKNP